MYQIFIIPDQRVQHFVLKKNKNKRITIKDTEELMNALG